LSVDIRERLYQPLAANPYLPAQTAAWRTNGGFTPDREIKDAVRARAARQEYVFPISAT